MVGLLDFLANIRLKLFKAVINCRKLGYLIMPVKMTCNNRH